MFYNEALQLFNDELEENSLKEKYTESELKKAYIKIIKLYHPDAHPNATPEEQTILKEKTQKINEAYKILAKKATITEPTKDTSIDNTKKYYLAKLTKYYSDLPDDAPEYFTNANLEIIQIIQKFNQVLNILKTKEKVVANFNGYKEQITNICDKVIAKFFEEHNLSDQTISNDTNLKKLFEQLNNFKEKRDLQVKKEIDLATSKYELYAGYEELYHIITNLKENALKSLVENKNGDTLKTLCNDIELTFKNYYQDKKRVGELQLLTNHTNDSIISDYLNAIETNITNHLLFQNYESIILARLEELNQEKNMAKDVKDEEHSIDDIYHDLLTRAKMLLNEYTKTKNKENINYINICLKQIEEVINLAKLGMINIESLELLNHLSFIDPNEDMFVFLAVRYNLDTISKREIEKILLNESLEHRCSK